MTELAMLAAILLGAAGVGAILLIAFAVYAADQSQRSRTSQSAATPRDLPAPTAHGSAEAAVVDQRDAYPYERGEALLTSAERSFFAVLCTAVPPGWHVFPQVCLASLVKIRKGTRNWKPHYSRVAQKCVDFVLCDDRLLAPQLVIELDDASHNRSDRQARDAFVDAALSAAGLPILHVRWQRTYDSLRLGEQIRAALSMPPPTLDVSNGRTSPPSPEGSAVNHAATDPQINESPPVRWACRRCGISLGATASYCPGCGQRLG